MTRRTKKRQKIALAINKNYSGSINERLKMYPVLVSAIIALICGVVGFWSANGIWNFGLPVFGMIGTVLLLLQIKSVSCRIKYVLQLLFLSIAIIAIVVEKPLLSLISDVDYLSAEELRTYASLILQGLVILFLILVNVIPNYRKSSPIYRRNIHRIMLRAVLVIFACIGAIAVGDSVKIIKWELVEQLLNWCQNIGYIVIAQCIISEALIHLANSSIASKYDNYTMFDNNLTTTKISVGYNGVTAVLQWLMIAAAVALIIYGVVIKAGI